MSLWGGHCRSYLHSGALPEDILAINFTDIFLHTFWLYSVLLEKVGVRRKKRSQSIDRSLSLLPVNARNVQGGSERWGKVVFRERGGGGGERGRGRERERGEREESRAPRSEHVERWGHPGDLML